MKQRVLFFLCSMVAFAGVANAQGKTVTNADLEKFKQKRVQAENDLRAYYAKLGLTQEDVANQEAAEAKEREELSARLRASRLEQERLAEEARRRDEAAAAASVNVVVTSGVPDYSGYYLYGNRLFPIRGPWGRPYGSRVQWRATPMGIVYEPGSLPSAIWSPRIQPRPRPVWRSSRRLR
jgi:septal ring factor EnvC (AmiA/AmiB activator)